MAEHRDGIARGLQHVFQVLVRHICFLFLQAVGRSESHTTTSSPHRGGRRLVYCVAAILRPNPTNRAPATRFSSRPADGCSRKRRPIAEANHTSTRHHAVPVVMKSPPRNRNASTREDEPGSTNCGRNARKNSATLGLSRLVSRPAR